MLVFVVDLENSQNIYEIEEGMLVSNLKDLIVNDFRMPNKEFKLFHKQKELPDYTLLTHALLGCDPTLVIYDENLYLRVEDKFIPSIYNQNENEFDDIYINFIAKCSKHPRFEEMMNLLSMFPISVTLPFVIQISKRIDHHEVEENVGPALFCSAIKQSIRFSRINDDDIILT